MEKFVYKIISIKEIEDGSVYPAGTMRIDFQSSYDGLVDWLLYLPGDTNRNAVVYLHASGGFADELFTRSDVRDVWLSKAIAGKHPIVSVNMRGTSYMSPAATQDLFDTINYFRSEHKFGRVVLVGVSGGASSAMAYACMHPEQIQGVIAMGMCDIFARLDFARKSPLQNLQELAAIVFEAYGATMEENPELYRKRSVMANADKLDMPIVLAMGEKDELIPVEETRKIVQLMSDKPNFKYIEIPNGDHCCVIDIDINLETLKHNK